ncbi:exopolyphosphatase [Pelotomaculum isophthalicicum JI]|uniref:Exopolyphosphatase n=1 Tax=Pelotomaculum isophthalicicum JI TaxID=947010 RepID=A0A9X4H665_9FIRM|nr:exopolyphosphatase [Pelotomaculum isophthalicicum]MDF9408972.1 exopolyphosphatase [Pelotomaculum isophthalicicum JI]
MRLLTRSDFDGLACAVLLKAAGIIDDRAFVHPKDIQDGIIKVTENDVLANVPFVEGCGLWFDHHSSEDERLELKNKYKGDSRPAPSAARVIYDYYGGKEKFGHLDEMMAAVDKSDSGQFTSDEILNPKGWVLLSFIMDPRTGLGRFRDYNISNYQLMDDMIEYCRKMSIDEILKVPDVQERIKQYNEQNELFKDMIKKHTTTDGNVIITDLRGVDPIYSGNRFMIYVLFPEQNISVWVIDGKNKQNCVFAVGRSIINRSSKTDVGSLMLKYGGGGHKMVGTCQVVYEEADRVMNELIASMKNDG